MGGIISGAIGGASRAMAEAGRMMLRDKLARERQEASDLRNRELRLDMQSDTQDFATEEREAGQTFKSDENKLDREATQKATETKATAAASKDGTTTNMKDAASLRALGYPDDVANAVAHGALKQIKDEETGDMVLINALNNKPVGRLTSSGGKKVWLPEGEMPENAPITRVHRKSAKSAAGDKASLWNLDSTDFPETGGDRKAWTRKESQRLANEERAGGAGGIINSAVKPLVPAQKPQGKTITAKQYKSAMKNKYPDISDKDLNAALAKARTAGKIAD